MPTEYRFIYLCAENVGPLKLGSDTDPVKNIFSVIYSTLEFDLLVRLKMATCLEAAYYKNA